jgi:2,5-diketo-D-gluconate reductase A
VESACGKRSIKCKVSKNDMTKVPDITLNDGVRIPQLGLGVWTLSDDQAFNSLQVALQAGYRHIDTAMVYGNEEGVGRAIAASGIPRQDIFVTTKLWNCDHGFDATLHAFDRSMQRLGLEQLDLYLIHWPVPRADLYVDTWRAFARLKSEKRVRSIGVSNFNANHLERIISETGVMPSVNQIEIHPDFSQRELVSASRERGIVVQAWSPLGQGGALLTDPIFTRIAEKHGKTPAQAILRWHIQQGYVVMPRSRNSERIRSNIKLFDFALDASDLAAIDAIARGNRLGPDPVSFNDLAP